jgi:hypothetical protein
MKSPPPIDFAQGQALSLMRESRARQDYGSNIAEAGLQIEEARSEQPTAVPLLVTFLERGALPGISFARPGAFPGRDAPKMTARLPHRPCNSARTVLKTKE